MEKILIWYVDDNGDTRIQVVDMPPGYLIQTLLYEFSKKPSVYNVLEAYTLKATHEIFSDSRGDFFRVETTIH